MNTGAQTLKKMLVVQANNIVIRNVQAYVTYLIELKFFIDSYKIPISYFVVLQPS